MASSIRKAQSPLSCQLCENLNVIKWKCKDCELLMCDNCKERIHPKFRLSETHTIISLKDVGKETSVISAQFASLHVSQPVISSVLYTYTSDAPAIAKIQQAGNDTMYCSYHVAKRYEFFILRLLKNSMKLLQNLDIECTDFALGSKDEIYYGPFHGSVLKVVSTNGATTTVLSTAPMVILCIHINKDNELILGLREQGSPFPVTEFSTRQIAVFDENNKRRSTFEYDQKGTKLFSYIWRIATDSDDNIYAIDRFENFDGRLVALERTGSVKFIYEGHSSINTSQIPFKPIGVVITRTNIIIITDRNTHSLHALNTKGDTIGTQNLEDLGITYPASLCLNGEGFLLVGCYPKRGNAKIHVAKIAI